MRLWPTPRASANENRQTKPTPSQAAGQHGMNLATAVNEAALWMTPTARDHKDGATTLANTPVNGLLGRQVLVTPTVGGSSCDTPRTLNPAFVEALMGWPTGWTGFGSAATAWSRWLPRMRCELSRLSLQTAADGTP